MAITGSLSEFSLPEIFQFLDQGQKTGILTIRDQQNLQESKPIFRHIWLMNGRVVAAGDRLDGRGLLKLIEQRNWLSDEVRPEVERLIQENSHLGLNLKSMGVLQPDQLKLLFNVQVLRQVCSLFQLESGQFRFNAKIDLPKSEMTGLSLPATETTLMGLRSLKDWRVLQSKLPDANSTLYKLNLGQSSLRLDRQESQIMTFCDGGMSLKMIAEQVNMALPLVQQIAFRLIVVGLVEELPSIDMGIPNTENVTDVDTGLGDHITMNNARTEISNSFLQSLVGFLQHKV